MENKLACIGQLTTIILLVSPLPQFVFCHKKSLEKNASIKEISFKYLLANFLCYQVWVAYSLKVDNIDLIIINMLGAVINTIFLVLYMYVKCTVGQHSQYMLMILVSLPMVYMAHSSALSMDNTGLFATTLSVMMYGLTLDSVGDTLKTRDGKTVNLGITAACIVNGLIWFFYSLLVKDIYLCIP